MTLKIYIVILTVLLLVINIETSSDLDLKYINNKNQFDNNLKKERRYLKKNYPTPNIIKKKTAGANDDDDDDDDDEVVFHTLAPTPSSEHTLSPTPHSLDHETPQPTELPTTNPYAPTRSPTEPPDETNGIIVVSVVFGTFLLGVLYFSYIKPNFISKKKVELSEINNNNNNNNNNKDIGDDLDLSNIYGEGKSNVIKTADSKDNLSQIGKTWIPKKSFDENILNENTPLIPK